jgi:hypothetical protein
VRYDLLQIIISLGYLRISHDIGVQCQARLAAQITSELRNKRPEHFYQVAYFDRREVRIH